MRWPAVGGTCLVAMRGSGNRRRWAHRAGFGRGMPLTLPWPHTGSHVSMCIGESLLLAPRVGWVGTTCAVSWREGGGGRGRGNTCVGRRPARTGASVMLEHLAGGEAQGALPARQLLRSCTSLAAGPPRAWLVALLRAATRCSAVPPRASGSQSCAAPERGPAWSPHAWNGRSGRWNAKSGEGDVGAVPPAGSSPRRCATTPPSARPANPPAPTCCPLPQQH